MTTSDFSHPQRMSPAALIIIFTKLFKISVAPLSAVVVINFLTVPSEKIWMAILIFIGVCFIVPLVWALISYLPKKFYIQDGNLIFIHGLIIKEKTIVPLDRVHSLRTERGIWFRILGMRGIIFDTIATRQEEIELILDEYEWKRLMAVIEKEEKPIPSSESTPPDFKPSATVRFPAKNLLMAALCQNHLKGMAILASILGVIVGNFSDLSEEQASNVMDWTESFLEMIFSTPLRIVLTLVIVYLAMLVVWLGKTLLRYYDTKLVYDSNLLTFTYGLLTRASCRFFQDKVCTIWIKRNFLEKHFGFSTLRLRQALNATAEKEDDNMVLYGTDRSAFFLKWWLGEGYEEEEVVMSAKSGKGVFYRHIALRLVIAIGLTIAFFIDHLYLWMLLPLCYLLIVIPRGICAMRRSRIELKHSYFVIHQGSFAEIDNFIRYSNVEVVGIGRTPFTRWSHRVSLSLSTSGSSFTVRSLPEKDALLIREFLLYKSEETNRRYSIFQCFSS